MAQPCQRVDQLDLLERQQTDHARRLTEVERQTLQGRVRDVHHSTRLAALEKLVERGFSAVTRDVHELRRLVTRLVWIVGGLYALLRWGPAAVDTAQQAFSFPPAPPAAAAPAHLDARR